MAVRRGGRGRRRSGKPKTDENGELIPDTNDDVDGNVDETFEASEAVEPVEAIVEIASGDATEPQAVNADDRERPADDRGGRDSRNKRGGRGRERQSSDRPASDRPPTDRPSGDRPSNDRPPTDRPSSERPTGDRPSGDRPSGERTERNDRGGRGRNDRNDRNDRGGRPQPLIADLLREGQEILVQIAKEPIAKKGARITSHIALPGRYLVYMPTIEHLGVSRKIESSSERSRLRTLIQRIRQDAEIPSGGFIVRTAGIGISEEDLRNDARYLARMWAESKKNSEKSAHRPLSIRTLTWFSVFFAISFRMILRRFASIAKRNISAPSNLLI
ncbi:MAG: ribonuclease E/G [Chloracidobacterium sp.]|nr:ribonuclease E/G [Chloracidobacterium sp.]